MLERAKRAMRVRTESMASHALLAAALAGTGAVLLAICWPAGAIAQDAAPPEAAAVLLAPAGQAERFEPLAVEEGAAIPWRGRAAFEVSVQSLLPVWGVAVDEIVIVGPRGRLPLDRLLVASSQEGGVLRPAAPGLTLAVGDPTSEPLVRVELEFRPQWSDPPGVYEITTVLRSFAPFDREAPIVRPSEALPLGISEAIVIRADVPEVVSVSVSGASLSFPGVLGPGRYDADREVAFTLSANAPRWAVVCQASPLRGDRGEIPIERLFWEQRDLRGRLQASGSFAEDAVVLQGSAPALGLEGRVAFAVQVLSSDHGGDYQGEVSLTGMSLP